MTLTRLLSQSLTIQKIGAGTADSYGDIHPMATGSPVPVLGFIEQVTSIENLNDRDTTITTWKAYLPAGTDIGYLDYINFNSQKFQVSGEPWAVFNPRIAAVSHIICELVVTRA